MGQCQKLTLIIISKSNVVIISPNSNSEKTININSLISTIISNKFSFINEAKHLTVYRNLDFSSHVKQL